MTDSLSTNPVIIAPEAPDFDTVSLPASPEAGSGYEIDTVHSDADTDGAGTVDVAKDQAASVGQSAAEAGQHVAGVAQDQARNVVSEAGSQAKDLLAQARSELSAQAGAQQERVISGLHALGDELHAMTQHSETAGVATDLARQGAGRSHDAATWLEGREPGTLVQELQDFARQRPGTFLLVAAGAGLLAGRLTRGVKDAAGDDSSTEASTPGFGGM